jgi:tRNA G46 methylase TrmB
MEIQDVINDIYSEYVSIKVGQNNLIISESEAISANFTDKVYSPDELYQLIKKKKEIISSDKKFVYGEIKKLGVETLYKEICELNSDLDTFVDVGSGNGKICLHLSLISNFESIVGIEIVTGRHLYAVELLQSLEHDFSNVTLLNDDIMSIEFERPCVVFTNDVCFPVPLTKLIFEKLPVGSHFISSKKFGNSVKEIYLNVTWQSDLFRWYYYIKN